MVGNTIFFLLLLYNQVFLITLNAEVAFILSKHITLSVKRKYFLSSLPLIHSPAVWSLPPIQSPAQRLASVLVAGISSQPMCLPSDQAIANPRFVGQRDHNQSCV